MSLILVAGSLVLYRLVLYRLVLKGGLAVENEGIQGSLTVVMPPNCKFLNVTQIVKLWKRETTAGGE